MGLGTSIFLIAVGAILKFAVNVSSRGFSVNTVGLILLIAGIVLFVASIGVLAMGSTRRTMIRQDVQRTPSGESSIEERQDRGAA